MVSDPDAEPGSTDADPDGRLKLVFTAYVVLANAIVLAVSVGGLVIVFRGQWQTGTALILAGLILAAYGVYRYPYR